MGDVIHMRKTTAQKAEAQALTDEVTAKNRASEQALERFYERGRFEDDVLRELEHCANKLFAVSTSFDLAEARANGAIYRAKLRASGDCGNS